MTKQETRPSVKDIAKRVYTEIRDGVVERQAHDLAQDALAFFNRIESSSFDEDSLTKRELHSDAYKIAQTVHTIKTIAEDPDRQYQIRFGDERDAYLTDSPPKPLFGTDRYRIVSYSESVVIGSTVSAPKVPKHTPEVMTRAVGMLLSTVAPSEFPNAHAALPAHVSHDDQYTYSSRTSVFYTKLSDSFTLKTALYPKHLHQGSNNTPLTARNMEVSFSLRVDDPQGVHQARYSRTSRELTMREIDSEISVDSLLEQILISDPNAKKREHTVQIPIPHGYTDTEVIHAFKGRNKKKWRQIGDTNTYIEKHGQRLKVTVVPGIAHEDRFDRHVKIQIKESKRSYDLRKDDREIQLHLEALALYSRRIRRSTKDHPVLLTKNRRAKKTFYDTPLSAPLKKHTSESQDPRVSSSRRFPSEDSRAELESIFPIPERITETLKLQRQRKKYEEVWFPPETTFIDGKPVRIVYGIVPSPRKTSSVAVCYRYRGEPLPIYTGTT